MEISFRPRSLQPQGIHAYATPLSVHSGEKISFRVSSTIAYRWAVARLGGDTDSEQDDHFLYDSQETVQGRPQPIHPGSFVICPSINNRPSFDGREQLFSKNSQGLSVQGWFRVFDVLDDGPSCLLSIGKGGVESFLAVFIQKDLTISVQCAGTLSTKRKLKKLVWHHIAVSFDFNTGLLSLWVDGQLEASLNNEQESALPPLQGCYCLVGGAISSSNAVERLYDGDVSSFSLHPHPLSKAEIQDCFAGKGHCVPLGAVLCWDFHEENGSCVSDISGNNNSGHIVNHATWMIGGPSFDAASVPRFGSYDPVADSKRGHGLRLSSDDLYDCQWKVTHEYSIPYDALPGFYAAKFYAKDDEKEIIYCVTFVVKRNLARPRPSICVIAASNTWFAYNASCFGKNFSGLKHPHRTTQGIPNDECNPPSFSFYKFHRAGQGTFYMGTRMPCPASGPYVIYSPVTDYSHLVRVERHFPAWLEKQGYSYDMLTDADWDENPDQLSQYKVVVINGHNEYWSSRMFHGLESFLQQDGCLLSLSGNTSSWRVSFNQDRTIIECRKVDFVQTREQIPPERRGECYHSQDGLRGGPLRECGYPGPLLHGLETFVCADPNNVKQFGPFRVETPHHFLFQTPECINLHFGSEMGGVYANGHEVDARLSTLFANQVLPVPEGAVKPNEPRGIVTLAAGELGEAKLVADYYWRPAANTTRAGELIYWERPNGGRVVNFGTINAGYAIVHDLNLQAFVRNVLYHFGVQKQDRNKKVSVFPGISSKL